jgi:hypothetical protein
MILIYEMPSMRDAFLEQRRKSLDSRQRFDRANSKLFLGISKGIRQAAACNT